MELLNLKRPFTWSLPVLFLLIVSCEKKPTACLSLDDTLEVGTFLTLESCSEDYEFITWEFSDGIGGEGETAQRQFDKEGTVAIRITAYSKGAYKSDIAEQTCDLSYRYIDRFEVIGNIPYDSLLIDFGNDKTFRLGDTDSSFTEEAPLIYEPSPLTHVIIDEPTSITLRGKGFSIVLMINDKFNFNTYKENPIVVGGEEDRYQMKVYWEYR